jgi:hypothetical protein
MQTFIFAYEGKASVLLCLSHRTHSKFPDTALVPLTITGEASNSHAPIQHVWNNIEYTCFNTDAI